ncbi:hypothetical protein [Streptomyces sp. NPDC020965]|uniref:hypothetical protein n=1 Tax=Streptomyces sp. NPDC020965 TaxID=3365105 RepID=UPI003794C7EB
MSSRREPPTHTTGAHQAHRRASWSAVRQARARHEPHLDGLFTYCLSMLRDHDTAALVLGDTLAVADRHRGRRPTTEPESVAWLYALARWACLRRLAQERSTHKGSHSTERPVPVEPTQPWEPAVPATKPAGPTPPAEPTQPTQPTKPAGPTQPAASAPRRQAGIAQTVQTAQTVELALLAWPEATGISPRQREALELAVRHGLAPRQVAAVLGLAPLAAQELLATAACEVERTRAALAVAETGDCPSVARLAEDHRAPLSPALRAELVRHVDDCPRCRRAAEREGARGPWPGSAVTPAALPLVPAPAAPSPHAPRRARRRGRVAAPRFGPDGFPLDPKDHAARRDRLRTRALTTTVVATVVAAPVLALWAAYRSGPTAGEGRHGASVSATDSEIREEPRRDPRDPYDPHDPYDPYDRHESTGNAEPGPGGRFAAGSGAPEVSVEVVSTGRPAPPTLPGHRGPGRLTVRAEPSDGTSRITLRASGGSAVRWAVWADASWLRPSRTSGVLLPGAAIAVRFVVDAARQPAGAWRARVGVDPSGALVEIVGQGPHGPPRPPSPRPPTSPTPSPSPPSPTPSPSDPSPSPTEPEGAPTSPPPSPSLSEAPTPSP